MSTKKQATAIADAAAAFPKLTKPQVAFLVDIYREKDEGLVVPKNRARMVPVLRAALLIEDAPPVRGVARVRVTLKGRHVAAGAFIAYAPRGAILDRM